LLDRDGKKPAGLTVFPDLLALAESIVSSRTRVAR
jgi:hypothetical protein